MCYPHHYRSRILICTIDARTVAAPASSKRARDDDDWVPSPDLKKARGDALLAQPESGDAQQAKLIIETSIADLGDISSW